jgi:hypothetical protein
MKLPTYEDISIYKALDRGARKLVGICKSNFWIKLRKKSPSSHTHLLHIQNFKMTAFALHSSMQITQPTRTVIVGNTSMSQLANRISLSLFLFMVRENMALELFFFYRYND